MDTEVEEVMAMKSSSGGYGGHGGVTRAGIELLGEIETT